MAATLCREVWHGHDMHVVQQRGDEAVSLGRVRCMGGRVVWGSSMMFDQCGAACQASRCG